VWLRFPFPVQGRQQSFGIMPFCCRSLTTTRSCACQTRRSFKWAPRCPWSLRWVCERSFKWAPQCPWSLRWVRERSLKWAPQCPWSLRWVRERSVKWAPQCPWSLRWVRERSLNWAPQCPWSVRWVCNSWLIRFRNGFWCKLWRPLQRFKSISKRLTSTCKRRASVRTRLTFISKRLCIHLQKNDLMARACNDLGPECSLQPNRVLLAKQLQLLFFFLCIHCCPFFLLYLSCE